MESPDATDSEVDVSSPLAKKASLNLKTIPLKTVPSSISLIESGSESEAESERPQPTQKKAKLGEKVEKTRWVPPKKASTECALFADYLRNNSPLVADVFAFINFTRSSASNWNGTCLCCGTSKTGSINHLLKHFTEGKCSGRAIPEAFQKEVLSKVRSLAEQRVSATARSTQAASASREPSKSSESREALGRITSYYGDEKGMKLCLIQQTARFFLKSNLPPFLGESEGLRSYVHFLSGGKLSHTVMEVLKRDALTAEMDKTASKVNADGLERWMAEARKRGGTLLLDGWSATKHVGGIGVALTSGDTTCMLPFMKTGSARSAASDYASKLEDVSLPWEDIFGLCTDGASNMVALGDLLRAEKGVFPVLCAAHGFSLTVHYIGKVFESNCDMFSKIGGLIAFFTRSTQRMAQLHSEYGSGLSFIKFCKTRMAYQTLALLRVVRLREAAQKAMISLKKQKVDEDESIDMYSKIAQVEATLNDDKLFRNVDIFCRVSFPVLLAMREVDRGTPMLGFVYWLHYHALDQVSTLCEKLVGADSRYSKLVEDIKACIVAVWEKRHRPVLSFGYLTNPIFRKDLGKEANVFDLDSEFEGDFVEVLKQGSERFLAAKRASDPESDLAGKTVLELVHRAKQQFIRYLSPAGLTDLQEHEAMTTLASSFWVNLPSHKFDVLSWIAARVHAMAVVTSDLERHFSYVGNVQSKLRSSTDAIRASSWASAGRDLRNLEQQAREREGVDDEIDVAQVRLIRLAERCERLQTEQDVLHFEEHAGMDSLADWIERLRDARNSSAASKKTKALPKRSPHEDAEESVDGSSSDSDDESVSAEAALLSELEEEVKVKRYQDVQADVDSDDDEDGIRRSKRVRTKRVKLNL
jgi:hypothetical protein